MREIELKPSRLLGLLLLGMAAVALTAIQFAALPDTVQLALGSIVIGLSVAGWRKTRCPEALRMTADGRLQRTDDQGEWRYVEVLRDSLASPALIVLRYRTSARHVRSLTLLPDSASPDNLRRLRVMLRWARRIRSDTASPDAG